MTNQRHAPYPADTRAKGWRFELDIEQIKQSDTWALAPADLRPWLLMLWCESWSQAPCGSLPSDPALLAARLGMPAKALTKHRAVLLRGWWLADDGRLYHDVIAERVRTMLQRKDAERTRKSEYRARMEAERRGSPASVPRDNRGTDAGRTLESDGSDATGTGTSTGLIQGGERGHPARARVAGPVPENAERSPTVGDTPSTDGHTPTPAGLICRAIKSEAGFAQCNPGDPRLLELIAQGATVEEFVSAATAAVDKAKGWAWLLAVVEGRRADAAAIRLAPKDTPPWHTSRSGIEAKGEEVGIGRWDQKAFDLGQGEPFAVYQSRVFKAAGHVNGRHTDTLPGVVSVSDIAARAADERRRIWAERKARKEQRTNQ